MVKFLILSVLVIFIVDVCDGEGLLEDFNDDDSNKIARHRNGGNLMQMFARLRAKLRKGQDTSLGDIDDISNDSGSAEEDLDFLADHGHLQTVLNLLRPNYASSAMNRLKFRDGD